MNYKKIIILIIIIGLGAFGGYFLLNQEDEKVNDNTTNTSQNKEEVVDKSNEDLLEFIKQIAGVKAQNIELIANPVGVKGEFIAPKEAILNGVDYFLKDTNNEKMKNIQIDLGEEYIYLKAEYEINKFINTPVEVKIKASVDSQKNLVLEVFDFKLLQLEVSQWIVGIGINSFIKDFVGENNDIEVTFDDGKVVIDKSNFNGISLENLSISKKSMKLDLIMDLEKIL